jgi:hypothetical protein
MFILMGLGKYEGDVCLFMFDWMDYGIPFRIMYVVMGYLLGLWMWLWDTF